MYIKRKKEKKNEDHIFRFQIFKFSDVPSIPGRIGIWKYGFLPENPKKNP
jgi:hypothetical protein